MWAWSMYEFIRAEPGNNLFLFTGTEGTAAGGLLQNNGLEKYQQLYPFGIQSVLNIIYVLKCIESVKKNTL